MKVRTHMGININNSISVDTEKRITVFLTREQ